jgi:hypothetical protein
MDILAQLKAARDKAAFELGRLEAAVSALIGVWLELNQIHQDTSEDVSICSEEDKSRAEGTMGKAKLDRSGGCQAARLSSIKKENGGCSTREMGEGQAEKSDLVFNCFLSET